MARTSPYLASRSLKNLSVNSVDHQNRRDIFRRFLGEQSGGRDPLITGFGVVFFTALPKGLATGADANLYGNWLSAMTTTFNLPDMEIGVIEYEGRDGGKWYVPGAATTSGDISLNLVEMDDAPAYFILSKWYHLLRNPHYGFMSETMWKHENYKGQLLYAMCTPDLVVRVAKVYNGIWPTSLKDSVFKYDQSQEKIEYEVTLKFDHYPYSSPEITSAAQQKIDTMQDQIHSAVEGQFKIAKSFSTSL